MVLSFGSGSSLSRTRAYKFQQNIQIRAPDHSNSATRKHLQHRT